MRDIDDMRGTRRHSDALSARPSQRNFLWKNESKTLEAQETAGGRVARPMIHRVV
jgi:hypothetical protein